MAYLGLALFAEGPTDHRFLSPLLLRAVTDVCLRYGETRLDIGDVLPLSAPEESRQASRATKVREAARANAGGFHLLFVHADGQGDPDRMRSEQVNPALDAVEELMAGEPFAGVAVIPVREMEAWALCDGDALRRAFQTTLSDEAMGVPRRPRDVEQIGDPKRALEDVYRSVVGSARRGRRLSAASFLALIGESVDLDRLREVPAFRVFHGELEGALRRLNLLRG
jgi:Domain of unknown function (DUF4276)